LNVAADEGDLSLVETSALTEKLTPVRVEVHEADELEYDAAAPTGFPWSQVLALVLLVLLLAEQALAYSASYHTPRRSAA
jgi:hypothetical protein